MSELHRKSYFKTSAEIPLEFGTMKGIKQRSFQDEFIIIAANLKQGDKATHEERTALINYLQKLYGANVDYEGLTTDVLKQCLFFRSPEQTKTFLHKNEGLGGWGKR